MFGVFAAALLAYFFVILYLQKHGALAKADKYSIKAIAPCLCPKSRLSKIIYHGINKNAQINI